MNTTFQDKVAKLPADPESFGQKRLEAIGEQLRAKIASKFTASTFLAGFALTVLAGQVFTLWQAPSLPPLFSVSVGVVFAAFIVLVHAVIRLDELTMPRRYFQRLRNGEAVAPPYPYEWGLLDADDLGVLFRRMTFFWNHLTLPATGFTAIAVLAMLVPSTSTSDLAVAGDRTGWSTAGFAATGIVLAIAYCRHTAARADRRFDRLQVVD